MKNKKRFRLVFILACILVVGMGISIVFHILGNTGKEGTLYWNIEKDIYLSGSGLSSREVEEDGYYHVRLAADGEQVEYRVGDKELVDKIDNCDLMGLEMNHKGVITDVLGANDVTGGEFVNGWYVTEIQGDKLIISDEKVNGSFEYNLTITGNTGVYDVSGVKPVGHSTTPKVGDCVRVYRNDEKQVIYVFIVKEEGSFVGNSKEKYCEHCKGKTEWYEWTGNTTLPTTEGHWYLLKDVKLATQQKIMTDKEVVVDLNGKTVSGAKNKRVYYVGADEVSSKLVIVDQSKKESGVIKGMGYVQNGGVIYVKAGTLELYSGTIDSSSIDTEYQGVAMFMDEGTICNMYGGTIIGGKTTCAGRAGNTSTLGGGGGSVYMSENSMFHMYQGTIRDGKTYACVIDNEKTWGIGGNVYVGSNATFIMEGGKISNGFADREGGNIYVSENGIFEKSGGEIQD